MVKLKSQKKKVLLQNLITKLKKQNVYNGNLLKSGKIIDVHFRRNLLEDKIYSFAGICISVKKRGIATSIVLRNVITLYTLEYTFNLFSPLVQVIIRQKGVDNKKYRSKLYYLRDQPAPLSKVNFKYLI